MSNELTQLRSISQELATLVAAMAQRLETDIAEIKARLDAADTRMNLAEARLADLERRMFMSPELIREIEEGSKLLRAYRERGSR